MFKELYRIYGNSRATGWVQLTPTHDYESAYEEAESLDPNKYYEYMIIGYNLATGEVIKIQSRFLDYDKPITLKKVNNENSKGNR